jgi:hypothetical protein
MTALEIANLALTRMNESTIDALTDDTYIAGLIRLFFKPVADEVTVEDDWQFARTRKALVEDTTSENLTNYQYMYDLPADCIMPRGLTSKQQYEIELGKLYTDDNDDPVLIYTCEIVKNETDPVSGFDIPVMQITNLPVTFCQAIALRLGSQIAPKITDNYALATALGREYLVMLEKSRSHDGMLSPAEDEETILWHEVS